MVSIVIISHSQEVASGARAMALQMCRDRHVVITAAGGLEDGSLGTSFEKIALAVEEALADDGVLILMDLGSAVMTTQMVVDMLPPDQQANIRLCNAPLVEGAIAAAACAASGQNLDAVQRAAEHVLNDAPKVSAFEPEEKQIPERPAFEPDASEPWVSADVVVPNPFGLHARPAMQLVQMASQFQAHITVQNLTQKRAPVNAKMPMQVAFGGTARQGEHIRIEARGHDAEAALARLQALVENGFGEMKKASSNLLPAGAALKTKIKIPKGPPPKRIQGIGVSEGCAVAPAFLYLPNDPAGRPEPVYDMAVPEKEAARLQHALREAKAQLEALQAEVGAEPNPNTDPNTQWIFTFHRMILEDAQVIGEMENKIRTEKYVAERCVRTVFGEWKDRAAKLDEMMRARAVDLQDVENRLLRILRGAKDTDWKALLHPCIVVAGELTPSDMARMDRSLVCGIASAGGGATSHTAILARNWGIPAVMGLGESVLTVADKTRLALDGTTGMVEVDPSDETAAACQKRADQFAAFQADVLTRANQPALTLDGKQVTVMANAGDPDSVREALRCGADGIGLLRTEFLYLNRLTLPEEDEQYRAYREIAEIMGKKSVVIRTLDVGGDKPLPWIDAGPELNPFLGVRAIRLCLKRPDIFQPQLRAILRAAAAGNVKIMFPMIATREEVFQARAALAEAGDSLARDGLEYATGIEVGIMIETPAAAINADILAREVDFLSIGSNDLTQYTLACDRGNRQMAYLFNTWDPAILRLIRQVIEGAHCAGKWVGLCGEFAGLQAAIPFLLGLGLNAFSVAPVRLPAVKQWIRQLDSGVCGAEAEKRFEAFTGGQKGKP